MCVRKSSFALATGLRKRIEAKIDVNDSEQKYRTFSKIDRTYFECFAMRAKREKENA